MVTTGQHVGHVQQDQGSKWGNPPLVGSATRWVQLQYEGSGILEAAITLCKSVREAISKGHGTCRHLPLPHGDTVASG